VDAGGDQGAFVGDFAGAVDGEDGAPVHGGPEAFDCEARVLAEEAEDHGGAAFVDGGADEALAGDFLGERVQLGVEGNAAEALGVVAEGGAGRFAEVVEGAVDEVDVVGVELDAAALEEVQEEGVGAFGDLPDGAGFDGDVG
jgi:hypothetical protein